MKTQYQLHSEITNLEFRQTVIESRLKNPHKHPNDPEWVEDIANIKAEHGVNAERIGYLQSQLKLIKLEAAL